MFDLVYRWLQGPMLLRIRMQRRYRLPYKCKLAKLYFFLKEHNIYFFVYFRQNLFCSKNYEDIKIRRAIKNNEYFGYFIEIRNQHSHTLMQCSC